MSTSLTKLIENNLNVSSVKKVVGEADQAMIYGWGHCHYRELTRTLKNHNESPLKQIYDYTIGDPKEKEVRTLEGRVMQRIKIPFKKNKNIHGVCKAGLTDLVLENYKRLKEGKSIIPIIFCIDSRGNPIESTPKSITTKQQGSNALVTNSEIRRCYKLCVELAASEDEELRKMADIAVQTFKFVKIDKKNGQAILNPLPPIWESKDFKAQWKARMQVNKERIHSLNNLKAKQESSLKTIEALETRLSNDPPVNTADLKKLKSQLKGEKNQSKGILRKINSLEKMITKPKDERWDQQLLVAVKTFNSSLQSQQKEIDFDSI